MDDEAETETPNTEPLTAIGRPDPQWTQYYRRTENRRQALYAAARSHAGNSSWSIIEVAREYEMYLNEISEPVIG